MNQLNETLRAIRIQLAMEERRSKPDIEKIRLLKKEEEQCLEGLK